MITRRDTHARDLLRRQRRRYVAPKLTFTRAAAILGEFIKIRQLAGSGQSPCPLAYNRRTWKMRLCAARQDRISTARRLP